MSAMSQWAAAVAKVKPYSVPEKIPLSFTYGGTEYRGLGEAFRISTKKWVIDANIRMTEITGTLPDGLEVTVEYREYLDFPAVEWYAAFCNRGTENSKILTNVRLIDECYEGENPVMLWSSGDTVDYETGYRMFRDPITETPLEMKTTHGPSDGTLPFMRLMFQGHGVNLAVGWPGNWAGEIVKTDGGAHVSFRQARLNAWIQPGETLRAPRVLVMSYEGDEADGRHQWRRFYFKHMMPKENGEPIGPMLAMTNPGDGVEFTKATEQNQIEGMDIFTEKGFHPDIWWLDAGWYPCNLEWVRAGTWFPNPEHFPNGLAPVGKKCEEIGTRFLLWFELERVWEGSWLDTEHPEWMLYLTEESGNISCTRMLNLANPDCMAWAIDHVDRLIKESHVKIYRQDFNVTPAAVFWAQNDTEGRAGVLENLHIQNLLTFWDTLVERNPGLWIDNCSSGGRRNDYELMRRSVPLHYTDVGYGVHPEKQQQYRIMFEWIPYFRSMAFSWDKPDGTYDCWASPFVANTSDKFLSYTAFAPAIDQKVRVFSTQEEMDTALFMLQIWRPAAELMLRGDYYPLIESHKSAKEWYACQFDDRQQGDGFFQVIRNIQVEEESVVIFPHVDKDAVYTLTCMDPAQTMEMTGAELAAGFTVALPPRSSVVWFYKKK